MAAARDLTFLFLALVYFNITGPTYAPAEFKIEKVIAFVSATGIFEIATFPLEAVPMKDLPDLAVASSLNPFGSEALTVTEVTLAA